MEAFTVNMTPDKSLMIKIGHKNYKVQEAIAELVDNSIDAKLPHEKLIISIELGSDKIIVEDNGSGMDKKTFANATILGKSSKRKKLGIYGLGLKTACSNLGKNFTIISSQKGVNEKYIFEFDEEEWMKNPKLTWVDYPCKQSYESPEKNYTKIIISNLKTQINAFGRRVENSIISDFGLRYGMMIKNGDIIIMVSGHAVEPNFPSCEEETKINFNFLLDKKDSETRIWGWVGLRWDSIREKVIGSQKGKYGFITYRNRRLITEYDDLKVDNEIFAIRRHPTWATIIGLVNMDCVPVENDKRNFIQEDPLYIQTVLKVREYVKKIEEIIKSRENESEIAEDIKEITEEIVNASEKALEDKDIKQIVEKSSDREGLENYGNLIKKSVSGKLVRTEQIVEDEKEYRNSVKKERGAIIAKETGKIRTPKGQVQRGKTKKIEEQEDPEGILEIDIKNKKIKVKHQYVNQLSGDSLRAWELTDQGYFLVKTNINHITDLTGKEYPVFALHNVCESLSEFCLNTNDNDKIVELRDELIRKTYHIISTLA